MHFFKLIFLICLNIGVLAKGQALSITWYGSTTLKISDSKSSLLLDAFFTRPSLTDIIFFKEVKSDKAVVVRAPRYTG